MSIATRKFNIVKLLLNKSIFDENIIHIILICYWNILNNKDKILSYWINKSKLDWNLLSCNPNAINLLKENKDKINWSWLSVNPAIFEDESMPII
tara:strand:- start:138 stop:422 length:285 start_codon:yes stop_codon:yes gene_type:complete